MRRKKVTVEVWLEVEDDVTKDDEEAWSDKVTNIIDDILPEAIYEERNVWMTSERLSEITFK